MSWISDLLIDPQYESSNIRLNRWTSVSAADERPVDREHSWFVIAFTHTGGFAGESGPTRVTIDATRTLLVRPQEPYRVSRLYGLVCGGTSLLIRPDLMDEIFASRPQLERRARATVSRNLSLATSSRIFALQCLLTTSAAAARDALELEETAVFLAHAVVRHALLHRGGCLAPSSRAPGEPDLVAATRAHLASAFDTPLRLESIARAVHASPYHLCRIFSRHSGVPMHRYVNQLRLRSVLPRIAAGEGDIGRIAIESGFSSHSHFTSQFRREFGIVPSEFRRLATTRRLEDAMRSLRDTAI